MRLLVAVFWTTAVVLAVGYDTWLDRRPRVAKWVAPTWLWTVGGITVWITVFGLMLLREAWLHRVP
jgi:hypothetical protein